MENSIHFFLNLSWLINQFCWESEVIETDLDLRERHWMLPVKVENKTVADIVFIQHPLIQGRHNWFKIRKSKKMSKGSVHLLSSIPNCNLLQTPPRSNFSKLQRGGLMLIFFWKNAFFRAHIGVKNFFFVILGG